MKTITLLILALLSSPSFANEELIKKLDALFDLRIKINEAYKEQYTEEAKELVNEEARKFLVKSEKENGQVWVDYLKHMKTTPDMKARLFLLRVEIVTDLNNGYYELEGAGGFAEKAKAKANIVKWKKALKQLEEAEALFDKPLSKEPRK